MATIAQKLALLGGNVDASGEVDSNTIDGLDSLQFLRSDASDTFTGQLTISHSGTMGADGALDTNAAYVKITDGSGSMWIDPNQIVSNDNLNLFTTSGDIRLYPVSGNTTRIERGGLNVISGDVNINSGNLNVKSGELWVVSDGADDGLRIQTAINGTDAYGVVGTTTNAVVLTNEQGSTNQAMVLNDRSGASHPNDTLFSLAYIDSTTNPSPATGWTNVLNLSAAGNLTIPGTYYGTFDYDPSSNAILSSTNTTAAIDELTDYVTTTKQTIIATAGQTTFNATYTVGSVDVFMNGLKLQPSVDFTASNGSTVVLTEAAEVGDVIDITAAGGYTVTDHYTKTEIANHNLITVDSSANLSGINELNTGKYTLTSSGTMSGGVVLDNYYFKIDDGTNGLYFDSNEIFTDSVNLHLGSVSTDGKVAISAGGATDFSMVAYNNGVHIASSAYTPLLATPSVSAALEVGGSDGEWEGGYNYTYTRDRRAGIGVYGSESSIEIAGNDSGNHAASLHLRNGNEGFALVNDPNENRLAFKSFTAEADNYYVHAAGSNASVVDAMYINKTGQINYPNIPAFTAYVSKSDATVTTLPTATQGTFNVINTVEVNVNDCYSIANNRFTAPVDGYYQLSYSMSLSGTTGTLGDNSVGFGFMVNGSQRSWTSYYSGLSIVQSTTNFSVSTEIELGGPSLTAILQLSAGDYVQIGWHNMSAGRELGVRSLVFSGFLVG